MRYSLRALSTTLGQDLVRTRASSRDMYHVINDSSRDELRKALNQHCATYRAIFSNQRKMQKRKSIYVKTYLRKKDFKGVHNRIK